MRPHGRQAAPAGGTRCRLEGAAKHYEGWQQTRRGLGGLVLRRQPAHRRRCSASVRVPRSPACSSACVRPAVYPLTAAQPLAFDFAIMVGGFVSNDPAHAALYESPPSFALLQPAHDRPRRSRHPERSVTRTRLTLQRPTAPRARRRPHHRQHPRSPLHLQRISQKPHCAVTPAALLAAMLN